LQLASTIDSILKKVFAGKKANRIPPISRPKSVKVIPIGPAFGSVDLEHVVVSAGFYGAEPVAGNALEVLAEATVSGGAGDGCRRFRGAARHVGVRVIPAPEQAASVTTAVMTAAIPVSTPGRELQKARKREPPVSSCGIAFSHVQCMRV
jgi:hypothetical protein